MTNKLKIIFGLDHYAPEKLYGYHKWAYYLSQALANKGHSIKVIAPKWSNSMPNYELQNNVEVLRYTPERVPSALWMFGRTIRYRGVKKMLRKFDDSSSILMGLPHYVCAAKRWAPSLTRIYRAGGTLLGAKPYETYIWPKRANIIEKLGSYLSWRMMLNREKKAIRYSKIVIVPSHNIGEQLSYYYGAKDNQIFVIPHGADSNIFKPGGNKTDGFLKIVTVGRMDGIKNHFLLLKALTLCKRINKIKVKFVGDGTLMERMKDYVKKNNLSLAVDFPGYSFNIQNDYQWADLFVLPSIHEPFGIVILEAMMSGLPVICLKRNPPNIWVANDEIIDPNNTGILLNQNDPKELADVLDELALRPERIKKMGEAAYKRAINYFSWDISSAKYETFLNEILLKKKNDLNGSG